jgi:hypothetical protein
MVVMEVVGVHGRIGRELLVVRMMNDAWTQILKKAILEKDEHN